MSAHADAAEAPRGFIDREARIEYARLAAAIFLCAAANHQQVVLPVIWTAAGFSKADIGLLFAVYGVPLVVLSFFSSWASNHLGLMGTARVGGVAIVLGLVSFAVTAESFTGSMASRILQGIGFGLFLSPIMAYATSRLTKERFVHLFSLLSSMAPLPQAIAPVYGEWLLHSFGPTTLFLVGAAPGLIGLPLLWMVRPMERAEGAASGYGAVLGRRRVYLPLLCNIAFGSVFGFNTAFLAILLIDRGLSVGTFFTSYTLVLFGVRFGLLGLVERLDRRLIVGCGIFFVGLGVLLASWAMTSPAMILAGIVFGLGHSTGFPVISTWLGEILPPDTRAVSLAVSNAVFFAASLGGPIPLAVALSAYGYGPVMAGLTLGCWTLAAGLIGAFLLARRAA